METEVWKPVVGYEGLYEVSNLWNIKSLFYRRKIRRDLILKWMDDKDWYKIINLSKFWSKLLKIHRLVALTFIPNPENKPQVNHKNWIRNDNRVENLEWCTPRDNLIHSYKFLSRSCWERKIKLVRLYDWYEKIFYSIKSASIELKLNSSLIHWVIKWKCKHTRWYKFYYID